MGMGIWMDRILKFQLSSIVILDRERERGKETGNFQRVDRRNKGIKMYIMELSTHPTPRFTPPPLLPRIDLSGSERIVHPNPLYFLEGIKSAEKQSQSNEVHSISLN
jgi:hypothetical protein